jgi:hypothetical protein
MAPDLTPASSTSGHILAAVGRAEHVRGRRELVRVLSRVVPAVAGALLLSALVVRFAHAPLATFWILFAVAVTAVVVFAWFSARVPAVTDAAAAQLDADASLGGELRSAHWFSTHPAADAWTAYHLDGAAERMEQVAWASVYPPVNAMRTWAGSTALVIAAMAVMLPTWPAARWSFLTGRSGAASPGSAVNGRMMPADLQKQIDELLKAIEKGGLPLDTARARMSDLRDELTKLDPKLQDAMASAQGESQKPSSADLKSADPKAAALADRAEKVAEKDALPEDMKWSLQDLADKLKTTSRPAAKAGSEANPVTKDGPAGEKQAAPSGQKPQDAGAQTRTTRADTQSNEMMATSVGPMGSDPQSGGADAARKNVARQPLDLSAVLRKEAVEADADAAGANVLADMRRKSEQSHSTLAFSHVAPLATYDTSHASPPPPPPDALRPLVLQYFIRR